MTYDLRTIPGLLSAILLLILVSQPRAVAGTTVYATLPGRDHDQVIVGKPVTDGGTELELWNPVNRTKKSRTKVAASVKELHCVLGRIVAASSHDIYVGPADLATPPLRIWHTPRTILRIALYRSGWMTLAADDIGLHPVKGSVYWFKTVRTTQPRLLSLRSIYNFWDIQFGDIDGDGRPVIALCTWSKTSHVRTYARRYFIYGMTAKDSYPRWRGSRLSRPYLSARLVKSGDGPDWKLLSVETASSEHVCLMLYQWDDFGFYGLGRSRELRSATLVRNDFGVPLAIVSDGPHDELVRPELLGGKLQITTVSIVNKGDKVIVGRFGSKKLKCLIIPGAGLPGCHIESMASSAK